MTKQLAQCTQKADGRQPRGSRWGAENFRLCGSWPASTSPPLLRRVWIPFLTNQRFTAPAPQLLSYLLCHPLCPQGQPGLCMVVLTHDPYFPCQPPTSPYVASLCLWPSGAGVGRRGHLQSCSFIHPLSVHTAQTRVPCQVLPEELPVT